MRPIPDTVDRQSVRPPPKPAPIPTSTQPRSAVRLAVRDFAPHTVALIPFSLAIGAASALNGLSLLQAVFGAVFLLAGTAQLAATELLGDGTEPAVVIATIVLINFRFLMYGASFARWFADTPLRQKLLLAVPLVDQSFLCCEERFSTMTRLVDRQRYYATGSLMLLTAFVTSQMIGYVAGPNVPDGLGLHLAAPLAFAGMLVNAIKGTPYLAAAATAGVTMVLCAGLPGGLCLPIAIVAGLGAGSSVEEDDPS